MSTTYTDLTETQFPDKVDDLSRMSDLTTSDLTLVNQYYTYYNAGNLAAAAQLLIDNPTLTNKIFNAAKFNILRDALIALQRYYKSDVQTYIDSTRDSLQGEIDSGMSAIRTDMAILDARIRAEKISSINQSLIKQNESQEGDIYNTMKDEALFRLKPLRGFDKIVNFRVNDSGFLEKRPGTRLAVSMPYNIRGALTVSTVDGEQMYVVAGSRLYKLTMGSDGVLSSTTLGTLSGAIFSSDTESVEIFTFAGKVCILAGGEYFSSDGSTVSKVEGYIPLIQKNTNSISKGEAYERINLLTNKVRMRFIADGSTREFRINYPVASVDAVYIGDSLLTPEDDYVVDTRSTYTLVTTVLAYSALVSDNDILQIYFTISKTNERKRVTSCTHSVPYGGDTDSRIFLWGGNEIANIFPSEPSDAENGQSIAYDYFPVGTQITVGDGNLPVCGACKQSGKLALFTHDAALYIQPEDTIVNDIPTQIFTLYSLNPDFGATAGGIVRYDNTMCFISNDSLYCVNSILDDNQTRFIKKIPPEYLEFKAYSESLKLFANIPTGEIWCYGNGNKIAIYNVNKDCWYRFEGIEIAGIFSYADMPCFYQGKKIYLTNPTVCADSGVNYNTYCETDWVDFGNSLAIKKVRRLGVKVGSGDMARVLTVKVVASYEPIKATENLIESSKPLREVNITFNIPAAKSPMVCTARGQLGKLCCIKMCIDASGDSQPCQIEEAAMMVVGANTVILRGEDEIDSNTSASDSGSESTT